MNSDGAYVMIDDQIIKTLLGSETVMLFVNANSRLRDCLNATDDAQNAIENLAFLQKSKSGDRNLNSGSIVVNGQNGGLGDQQPLIANKVRSNLGRTIGVSTSTTTMAPLTNHAPTSPSVDLRCPDGWTHFRNKCYHLTNNRTTFDEGEKFCQQWGGHLASIHDEAENDFAVSLYDSSVHVKNHGWFRVGGVSLDVPNYHWIDGSRMTYSNWDRISPIPDQFWSTVIVCPDAWCKTSHKKWQNTAAIEPYVYYSLCSIDVKN